MKKQSFVFSLLIIFCFTFNPGFSQNQQKTGGEQSRTIDSLLLELDKADEDTNRVNLLINISDAHVRSDPAKAREFAALAVETATDLEFISGLAKGHLAIGVACYYQRNFDDALANYEQSEKYFKLCSGQIGLARVYHRKGSLYSSRGAYDNAQKLLLSALGICEDENNLVMQAEVLNAIAGNYKRMFSYEKAIEYIQRSISIRRQLGDRRKVAIALNNIAAIYTTMLESRKALIALDEAVNEADSVNDQDVILVCKINMANSYMNLGEYDKALKYVLECLRSYTEAGNKLRIIACLGIIANIHLEQGGYKKSIELAQQSIDIAKEIEDLEYERSGYLLLQEAYDSLGDHEKALRALERFLALQDVIYEDKTQSLVAEMEAKYEGEKKDKLNALLQEEKAKAEARATRNLFTALGAGGLLLAVVVIVFLYIRQRKAREYLRRAELEQKALRSQMNPHFISNSLIAIQSFIYKKDPKEAGKYLANFAKLMRLILENSREEYVPLEKEIKTLEYYLELQALRFENKFDYSIDVDSKLDTETIAIPPMLAQPFIENALEHGILHKNTDGMINVRFNLEGDLVRLEVEDNGIGRQKAAELKQTDKKAHHSLATTITEERLAILNKKNSHKIKLQITDLKSPEDNVTGTRATFQIPYRNI